MLTELVGKQWRGELRFVSGAPVFADVAVTVTSSSSSSSSSLHDSSRSLLRSSVHRQSFCDQPTRSTPHPRYRCARTRSINALRRLHGGGKRDVNSERRREREKERERIREKNGRKGGTRKERTQRERRRGRISSVEGEGWPRRWNEEGDQPRRIRPNFSFFRPTPRRPPPLANLRITSPPPPRPLRRKRPRDLNVGRDSILGEG